MVPIIVFSAVVPIAMSKYPMYFFDGEYAMYQQQKDYVQNSTDYNRIVIIGDSKAKAAYCPWLLSDDTYNFSLGGTSPLENYYYFKEYLGNHDAPQTVIISYAPFHFFESETLWTRSVYFHRMSDSEMKDIYTVASAFDDTDHITKDFYKQLLLYRIYSVNKYGKTFLKALLKMVRENRYKINAEMYQNLSSFKGYASFGKLEYCDAVNPEADYTDFEPTDILDNYFRKMIELCIHEGINVIIDTLPMNKATYEACHENYLLDYSNYMKGIQRDYPEITVNTDLCFYDNTYFGDSTHLNRKGAEKYSEYMKNKYPELFTNHIAVK